MDATPATDRSLLGRFQAGFTNVLGWSPADKCFLGAIIVLTFVTWYTIAEFYVLRHPEAAPYLDRTFLEISFRVHMWEFAAWPAIALAALWVRRRSPSAPALVYITMSAFIVTIAIFSYLLGHLTSLFAGLAAMAGLGIGLVLFDARPVLISYALYLFLMVGMTIAEQANLIPYAPMLAHAPFQTGRLSHWWLANIGAPTFGIFLLAMGLFYSLVTRWHHREDALRRTSEQLAHANDIISRYVATQLVSEVKSGNYQALDRQERRKLSLFFSDIEDFAATADLTEPEDLAEVLNDYLAEMTEIGKRHGATIDKFVGDAIMIFFGAPEATDDKDHALRAVRMAIEMQNRMGDLQTRWLRQGFERPFRIRIGINTGHANIGNFGSKERLDYTAIGRQVNLAARLQAHCQPGRILISHATWVLVQDDVICTPKGEVQVKGFHQPVKVYEVVAPQGAESTTE